MVAPLDIAIQLSDLFEVTGYEGTPVAVMFDTDILPALRNPLHETDMVGLGKRFSQAIDRVRHSLSTQGGDHIRTLKDMMKAALVTYVQKTNDAHTGRSIFHRAIMSGGDTMLTVTGAAILANALTASYPEQAQALLQGVERQLSGEQPVAENASMAAVSVGAITTTSDAKKRKQAIRRRDSIFAEELTLDDLEGKSDRITKLSEVVDLNENQVIENVIVDPITAELVLCFHDMLPKSKQRLYHAKSISEMIELAQRAVQRGILSVIMD